MGWVTAVLTIVSEFFKNLPILNRWFTRSTSEKIESKEADVRKEMDEFKEDGRPKWH